MRVVGARLVQFLEHDVATQKQNVVASTTGGVAKRRGNKRLANADGAQEQHVLVAFDKAEPKQVTHAIAVEGDGRIPVEAFECLLVIKRRTT